MAQYHSPKDYLDAARSPTTSPAELRVLARSEYTFVLEAVARNPNTEDRILRELLPSSLDSVFELARAVALAENPAAPEELLGDLARSVSSIVVAEFHRNWYVKRLTLLLCANPRVALVDLQSLLHPEDIPRSCRKAIAQTTRRPDILRLLSEDRSEVVRRRAEKSMAASQLSAS